MSMNKKEMLQGVLLLTIAAFIAKVLSAVYRIPLENFVGDTGFYVYQQIYPIYGIGMTLALNGLPIFISKLIVEQPTLTKQNELAGQLMRLLTVVGVVIFVGLNVTAELLASLMGDRQLSPVIHAVSWMFLWLPIMAVGRGVAQGQLKMQATAISQVLEQIIRVAIIVVVAYCAMVKHWNVYLMGTLAMLSAPIASGVASSLFFKASYQYWYTPQDKKWTDWNLWSKVGTEGALVSAMAALLIILQLIDSFTVQNELVANGYAPDVVRMAKGVYDRAQPIVQFGLVIATSFGTSLVPQLRKDYLAKRWQAVTSSSSTLLRLTLWVASAATVGMISLMPAINQLLFGTRTSSNVLSVYLLSAIVMSLLIILTSILQSIDVIKPLRNGLLVAVFSKIGLNLLLIHYWDLIGASWATVGALSLMLWCVLAQLPNELKKIKIPQLVVIKMILNLIVMAAIVVLVRIELEEMFGMGRLATIMPLGIGALLGGGILIILTLLTNTLTEQELALLPFGDKIIRKMKNED